MAILKAADAGRNDLLQRISLIEEMIAEGRRATTRNGWIFVLWGVIDLLPMVWRHVQPHSAFAAKWSWPICLMIGAVATRILRKRQRHQTESARNLRAVWSMMGLAMAIYVLGAMLSGTADQVSYFAGILIILGMAQATSAIILRWYGQGAVAVLWWLGALATFFDRRSPLLQTIVLVAVVGIGLLGFGVYAILLERRGNHA